MGTDAVSNGEPEWRSCEDIKINVDGSTGRTYKSGKYTAVELGMTQNDIWNLNSQCSRFTSGIVNDGVFVIFSWCGYLTRL